MKIYKYQLDAISNRIAMPRDAKVLTMQLQNGNPCIWALVDPQNEVEVRTFVVIPTGDGVFNNPTYIGTFQDDGFVGHVFETH